MGHPTSKWGQDAWRVFITFNFNDWSGNSAVEISDKSVSLKNPKCDFLLLLSHSINSGSSTFVDRGNSISVTLKKTASIHWSSLSETRLPNLSIDWSRWTDEDDECYSKSMRPPYSEEELESLAKTVPIESIPQRNVQEQLADCVATFTAKDSESLCHAPDLCDGPHADSFVSRWISFWLDSMTLPQRMLFLVEVWNILDQSERENLVRYLIEMLASENPAAASCIKGGESVLRDLDPSHYKRGGTSLCLKWMEQLKLFDPTIRMSIITLMFEKLNSFDKKLVMSTFM